MELPNDLLIIITRHTIPDLTLSLLGSYRELASIGYAGDNLLWKDKARVETAGLMLDDPVILASGSWRLYYFLVVRNNYGDAYTIPRNQDNPTPTLFTPGVNGIKREGVRGFDIIRGSRVEKYCEEVIIDTIRLPRKVIEHVSGSTRKPYSNTINFSVSITEDGSAYYTRYSDEPGRRIYPEGIQFVQVTMNGTFLLDRDGDIYHYNLELPFLDPTLDPNLPRAVSIGVGCDKLISLIHRTGHIIGDGLRPILPRAIPRGGVTIRYADHGKVVVMSNRDLEKISITPGNVRDSWVDLYSRIHSAGRTISIEGGKIWQLAETANSYLVLVTK